MNAAELDAQVASLRKVGGVYDYVADCVEFDNRAIRLDDAAAPLSDAQLESLDRFGVPAADLHLERTKP